MALQLQKEMTTGVSANYYSIREIIVTDTKIKIKLDLHISKEMKDDGKTAIEMINIAVDHIKSETQVGNIYEIAYNAIKASNMVEGIELNDFVNAVDV